MQFSISLNLIMLLIWIVSVLNGMTIVLFLQHNKEFKIYWKILILIFGSILGALCILIIVIYCLIEEVLKDYIWVEIKFLWSFYIVKNNWIEAAVLKDPNCLYNWNTYAERRNNKTYFDRRWTRHINMINKRYNYDFKADKEKRSKSENEDERFTESR